MWKFNKLLGFFKPVDRTTIMPNICVDINGVVTVDDSSHSVGYINAITGASLFNKNIFETKANFAFIKNFHRQKVPITQTCILYIFIYNNIQASFEYLYYKKHSIIKRQFIIIIVNLQNRYKDNFSIRIHTNAVGKPNHYVSYIIKRSHAIYIAFYWPCVQLRIFLVLVIIVIPDCLISGKILAFYCQFYFGFIKIYERIEITDKFISNNTYV